jgi:hypothetical protein
MYGDAFNLPDMRRVWGFSSSKDKHKFFFNGLKYSSLILQTGKLFIGGES